MKRLTDGMGLALKIGFVPNRKFEIKPHWSYLVRLFIYPSKILVKLGESVEKVYGEKKKREISTTSYI